MFGLLKDYSWKKKVLKLLIVNKLIYKVVIIFF